MPHIAERPIAGFLPALAVLGGIVFQARPGGEMAPCPVASSDFPVQTVADP